MSEERGAFREVFGAFFLNLILWKQRYESKMLMRPDGIGVLSKKIVEWKNKIERKICSFLHRQTLEETNKILNAKL